MMNLKSNHSMVTPRSSGSNQKRLNCNNIVLGSEVNAIKNPTKLFQRINSGDWEGALSALQNHPVEASVWVCQHNNDSVTSQHEKTSWKYLPLHLVCLQKRPPITLLQHLLETYPDAASLPTPHDGNLPVHYVCESGCDSSEMLSDVLSALVNVSPQSLEIKNANGKTPLLLCSIKSRQVLVNVLRNRRQISISREKDVIPLVSQNLGEKCAGGRKKNSHFMRGSKNDANRLHDKRNDDSEFVSRDMTVFPNENRQSPSPNVNFLKPVLDDDDMDHDDIEEDEIRQAFMKSEKNMICDSYSDIRHHVDPLQPKNISMNKTCEEDLHKQYAIITDQNKSQKLIEASNEKMKQQFPNSYDDKVSIGDAKLLCQRILAKSESESVKLRAQIQQLQDEVEQQKLDSAVYKETLHTTFTCISDMLRDKGQKMHLNLFSDDSVPDLLSSASKTVISGNPNISTEHTSKKDKFVDMSKMLKHALTTIFTDMDERNDKLQSKVISLEQQLASVQVQNKTVQSQNHCLHEEKDLLIKIKNELEKKVFELDEEMKTIEMSLRDEKEKNSTLTVIKNSLQEQIGFMSIDHLKTNEHGRNEMSPCFDKEITVYNEKIDRCHRDTIQSRNMEVVSENNSQFQSLLLEQESLKEKNKALKEAILLNNEKYFNKVQELGEKYVALEKVNMDLRQKLGKYSTKVSIRPTLNVSLEGEDKLLYEV